VRPEVDRVDPGQAAVPLADRGAHRTDYERLRHHASVCFSAACPIARPARPGGTQVSCHRTSPPRPRPGPFAARGAVVSHHEPQCRRLEPGSQKPQVQEAAVSGLILLVLIGIVIAYVYTRLRGKMKLSVSGKNWIAPVVIVVVVVLLL